MLDPARRNRGLSKAHSAVRDEKRQQMSSSSSTHKRKSHIVASRRRWLEHQGERVAVQENWQNEWHDTEYQGIMAKALRA